MLPTLSKDQMKLCRSMDWVAESMALRRQSSAVVPSLSGSCQFPLRCFSMSSQTPAFTGGGVVSPGP